MTAWLRWLPVGAATLAFIVALGYGFTRPQPIILNNALLPAPQALPAFELQSTASQTFTQQALLGGWSLLFSGYTQCPDVCPTTLSLLAQLKRNWPKRLPQFHLVFVTVDPYQDNLASLSAYLGYFDVGIVGLTGAPTELNKLLTGMGFYAVSESSAQPQASGQARLLSHSGAVALVNPHGDLHALLRAPLTLASLNSQLQQILSTAPGA